MESDMEMGEGQPKGCPLFLGRERRFWREYAAGQRSASDAWIFWAFPLSLRKNAKGGEKSAQLAFGSNSVIFSHNAVSELLRVYTVSAEVAHSDPLTLFHTFPILHILFF